MLLAALERWGLVLPRMKPGVCVWGVCVGMCVCGGGEVIRKQNRVLR